MANTLTARFRDFPAGFYQKTKRVLISGEDSLNLPSTKFVIVYDGDMEILNLEIKYEYQCSPFKQIEFINDFIAIGFEEFFYLYNLETDIASKIRMEGYFGHIYIMGAEFLVCSSANIICFDKNGDVKWICNNLGIDGVVVDEIKENVIIGSGEWDPPGGWQQFKISSITGKVQ